MAIDYTAMGRDKLIETIHAMASDNDRWVARIKELEDRAEMAAAVLVKGTGVNPQVVENMEKATIRAAAADRELIDLRRKLEIAERSSFVRVMENAEKKTGLDNP